MSSSSPTASVGIGRLIQRVLAAGLAGALTLVVALSGFVLVAIALVVGLGTFAGLYLWARLRGGSAPPVQFAFRRGGRPGAASRSARPTGEVVDVEAIEVDEGPGRPRD